MWKRIILAAVMGLGPAAVPMDATAAVPLPAPATAAAPAPQQDCEQVKAQAQKTVLATGKGGTVACTSQAPAQALSVTPDVSTQEEAGCGIGSWVFGRHSACISQPGYTLSVLRINENGTATLVGEILYTVQTGNVTSGVSSRWTHRVTITVDYMWGAVSGSTLSASAECGANCSMVGWGFDSGLVFLGTARGGTAQLATTSYGVGSIWRAWSTWRFWFSNPAWIPTVSNSLTLSPPAQRCDEAIGITGSIGCVYDQKRPLHEIGRTRFPKYARHVELAINFGLPSVLTRTQISSQVDANRARACPQSPSNGWSCDEYPYASTQEGAANPIHPYGRTFQILNWNSGLPPFYCGISWVSPRQLGDSRGYSVCGIPLEENTGGGTDLGVFYVANRVLHNDTFAVKVV